MLQTRRPHFIEMAIDPSIYIHLSIYPSIDHNLPVPMYTVSFFRRRLGLSTKILEEGFRGLSPLPEEPTPMEKKNGSSCRYHVMGRVRMFLSSVASGRTSTGRPGAEGRFLAGTFFSPLGAGSPIILVAVPPSSSCSFWCRTYLFSPRSSISVSLSLIT